MKTILAGDLLFYWGRPRLVEDAVLLGEMLEDGHAKYYHCGIAVNATEMYEANGGVRVRRAPIDFSKGFDIFRLPIDEAHIKIGLNAVAGALGQGYDWWMIVDQGLRDLSHSHVHLPEPFLAEKEEHLKICSTLVQYYLKNCHFYTSSKWDSPQDVADEIQTYKM